VAGIAAAESNAYGFIGVAHYPRGVASVKVCDLNGGCRIEDVAGGLDWTATNGKAQQIVSMSLGFTSDYSLVREYVSRSANAGNLLVAAAGNNVNTAFVTWPGRYSQVMAVAGTLPDDSPAGWITCPNEVSPYAARSNFGPEVEISAPFYAKSMWLHQDYQTHCGTSMATPVVSAVAALVWTRFPTWPASSVRSRLTSTAVDLGPAGRDQNYGWGRVDAFKAVNLLSASIGGPTWISTDGSYTWTAYASGGTGSYSYQWQYSSDGFSFYDVGTGDSYTTYAGGGNYSFWLRAIVTSGDQTAAPAERVTVSTSCGGAIIC
jgi:subtilisin family serine protease